MNGDGISTCVHCGRRVVLKNYALGPKWMHQPAGAAFDDPAGAAFDDYVEEFCQRTVATPVLTETPAVLTGQVAVRPWPDCPEHKEVQHRDRKAPWCNICGWNRGSAAISPQRLGW